MINPAKENFNIFVEISKYKITLLNQLKIKTKTK